MIDFKNNDYVIINSLWVGEFKMQGSLCRVIYHTLTIADVEVIISKDTRYCDSYEILKGIIINRFTKVADANDKDVINKYNLLSL